MRRNPIASRWLVVLAFAPAAWSATNLSPVSVVSASMLAVDGINCGRVLSWEGGDPRASVVTESIGPTGAMGKHLGQVMYAPLVVQMAFPPPLPIVSWINELCANQTSRRKLVLTDYNSSGVATAALEALEVMLTEVRLPAFDATVTSAGAVTLVFSIEFSREVAPTSASASSLASPASSGQFILTIEGLDSQRGRIESISIIKRIMEEAVGEARVSTRTAAATEFSNLIVTLANTGTSSWKAWLTAFAVNGNNANANEKSGSIQFFTTSMTPTGLALNFSQLGIMRVSRVPVSAGTPGRDVAELYFERLTIGAPPTATAGADSTAKSQQESTSATPTEQISPTQNSISSTDAVSAPLKSPTGRTPADDTAWKGIPASSSKFGPAPTIANPGDQGTRDPRYFPRVAGLTRKSYTGYYQKIYNSESSVYTSPDGVNELVARVEAAATADGWELASLNEYDTPNGKSVSVRWLKPQLEANLGFVEPPSGGTNLSITVNFKKPEGN